MWISAPSSRRVAASSSASPAATRSCPSSPPSTPHWAAMPPWPAATRPTCWGCPAGRASQTPARSSTAASRALCHCAGCRSGRRLSPGGRCCCPREVASRGPWSTWAPRPTTRESRATAPRWRRVGCTSWSSTVTRASLSSSPTRSTASASGRPTPSRSSCGFAASRGKRGPASSPHSTAGRSLRPTGAR